MAFGWNERSDSQCTKGKIGKWHFPVVIKEFVKM